MKNSEERFSLPKTKLGWAVIWLLFFALVGTKFFVSWERFHEKGIPSNESREKK
jgi:hypothetical protein